MKLRKRLIQGLKLAAPVAAAIGGGADEQPLHGDIAIWAGPAGPTARVRVLLGDPAGSPEGAGLLVGIAGDEGDLGEMLARRRRAGRASLVVLLGTPEERARQEVALTRGPDVEASSLLHLNALDDEGLDALMGAVVRALGERSTAAARRNPALRPAVGRMVVDDASRRAGLMGALPLRGADLPALARLQIHMVARLSAVHDRPPGPERVLEAAAIVGAGFGWRAIGRAGARVLPGGRAASGGAVAYAGTRAIGEAALARMAAGHDLIEAGPLERFRPQVDRLLGRAAERA